MKKKASVPSVEPNISNINAYAVNGAVHYANAILHYTDYTNIFAVGMTGWRDETKKTPPQNQRLRRLQRKFWHGTGDRHLHRSLFPAQKNIAISLFMLYTVYNC